MVADEEERTDKSPWICFGSLINNGKSFKTIKMKTWMVAIPVDVSWARAPEKTSRAVALIWKYLGFPILSSLLDRGIKF